MPTQQGPAVKMGSPPGVQAPPSYQTPPEYSQPQYAGRSASTGLQQNVAGVLCYILGLVSGILFLVLDPYNKNRFVRFHAFQSIFLHVAWIALWIVANMFRAILPWGLSLIASLFHLALVLGGLVIWVYVMLKAYNNEKYKIPVIGDIAEQQAG
jgi:uncharacterized membrane protein